MPQSSRGKPRVLIVGAGPAGLALAIELGHRGIPCLLVERNARVGHAPRAKTTHCRTREHLRRWGIADELAAASPLGIDYPANVHFVTRLNGRRLHVFEDCFGAAPAQNPLYAEHAQWIPQYTLEEVLRRHAQSLPGVDIRFNCSYLGFEQDGDRVVSTLVDSLAGGAVGEPYTVQTDYLVGADGARSGVRDAIGATMRGESGLSRNYNIIFRAPGLAEAHNQGPGVMYWQVNPDMPSLIGPMDRDDKWFFMPTRLPMDKTFTEHEAVEAIKRSTGIDLPYEILSSDEWVANALIADYYRKDRVFLVGDACHLHPPFGGFGMFLGMLDAVDLGWKMAAVLRREGGQALLDTYELERKQVHQYTVDAAVRNHSFQFNEMLRPGIEDAGAEADAVRAEVSAYIREVKDAEFHSLGVVLGYRYENSPIIVGDGACAPPQHPVHFIPSASPGCRAPHAWLADGSSLFDHFGRDFTLLHLGERDPELEAAATNDARRAGIALKYVAVDEAGLPELYEASHVLIRPDQHVAWRGAQWPGYADGLLARIAGFTSGSNIQNNNVMSHAGGNTP